MKADIHPVYFPEVTVTCSCGNSWVTGSTQESLQTDLCHKCHPFYTGEQRIVDTEGQVERFYRKLEARQQHVTESEETAPQAVAGEIELGEIGLSKRALTALSEANISNAEDVIGRLAECCHGKSDGIGLVRWRGGNRSSVIGSSADDGYLSGRTLVVARNGGGCDRGWLGEGRMVRFVGYSTGTAGRQ